MSDFEKKLGVIPENIGGVELGKERFTTTKISNQQKDIKLGVENIISFETPSHLEGMIPSSLKLKEKDEAFQLSRLKYDIGQTLEKDTRIDILEKAPIIVLYYKESLELHPGNKKCVQAVQDIEKIIQEKRILNDNIPEYIKNLISDVQLNTLKVLSKKLAHTKWEIGMFIQNNSQNGENLEAIKYYYKEAFKLDPEKESYFEDFKKVFEKGYNNGNPIQDVYFQKNIESDFAKELYGIFGTVYSLKNYIEKLKSLGKYEMIENQSFESALIVFKEGQKAILDNPTYLEELSSELGYINEVIDSLGKTNNTKTSFVREVFDKFKRSK